MADKNELKGRVDELMGKVEAMEWGGDLEGLLEKEIAGLKKEIYEAALQSRQERAAGEADFPPSGVRGV